MNQIPIESLRKILPIQDSFDMIEREFYIGNQKAYMVFIDGFAKDDMMYYIIHALQDVKEDMDVVSLIQKHIAYLEVTTTTNVQTLADSILSGTIGIIVDNHPILINIDAREYPARYPEESETEKVTRGSKDGFVETIVFNTSLIRRRVRNPKLVFEMKTVGSSSKTDVCISYIKGKADPVWLAKLKEKIDSIDIESLVMAEKSLEELLVNKKWYNPLPQIKYTQRPDIVASYLNEGHVVVLVDTSPNAMITPSTFFYFTEFAEDYYQNPMVGTFNRWIRLLTIFGAFILTPLWLLLATHPEILPQSLHFIGHKEVPTISLFMQFVILELGFELLKTSSLHTPGYLGGAFGIIGGLLLGDFAVSVGFFIPETIFYGALTAMATYCIPNVEFSSAIRMFRFFLLICTGFFGIPGFVISLLLVTIITFTTNTLDKNRKYMWPLFPFDGKALSHILIRRSVKNKAQLKNKN